MKPDSEGAPRGELNLLDVVRVLVAGRWTIILTTLVFSAAGVAYALLATPRFRTETVLVPVSRESGLAGGLAQFSGLASLAGVDLGSGTSEESTAILKSRELLKSFIEERGLLKVLFADQWDSKAGAWKEQDPSKQPDIRDAVRYFDEHVREIRDDKKNGVIVLSITWKNAEAAADWANELAARVNVLLRERALTESQRNITYLRQEMSSTSVVPLQQTIGKVMETEMQKLLMARGSEEFAFKIVDTAVVPRKAVKPRKVLIAVGSFLAGGFISVLFVLISSGLYGTAPGRVGHREEGAR